MAKCGRQPRPLAVAAGEARARVCREKSWASWAAAKEAQVSIPCKEVGRGGPSRPLAGTPEQTREIADPRGLGLSCGVGPAPWTQLEV